MPVAEHNLKVLIVDEHRVILLVDDRPPMELDDAATAAITRFLAPTPAERKRLKAEPWRLTDDLEHVAQLATLDVIEPAPEQHRHMPRGITRNVTGRKRYPGGAGYEVLRAVAELGKPGVAYHEIRTKLVPAGMKEGTVGSQLFTLARDGYLLKQRNATKHALIYTLTTEGEDILTHPEPNSLDLESTPHGTD